MAARGVSVRVVVGGPGGEPCRLDDVDFEPCEVAIRRALIQDCDRYLNDLPESLFSSSGYAGQHASFEVVYNNGVVRLCECQQPHCGASCVFSHWPRLRVLYNFQHFEIVCLIWFLHPGNI